jgi:phage terminase large subunit
LSTLKIETPRVFKPLLLPSRYKGAYGGRGSGKSHFFAEKLVEDCLEEKGLLAVCIREVQKSLMQSSKRLLEAKIAALDVGHLFKVFEREIETPGDGLIIFQGMQDATAESIKSLEGFKRAWIEEAQVLSARSLTLLRPTIRAKDSEVWASWNPRRKSDAVDDFFRGRPVPGAVTIHANWRDNPWFPAELEAERQLDFARYPDRYDREARNGFSATLLATMAHEMCHLRQELTGDRGHHTVAFKRMAARVCRAHGFDLKTF